MASSDVACARTIAKPADGPVLRPGRVYDLQQQNGTPSGR
jgi:hypothetical protein